MTEMDKRIFESQQCEWNAEFLTKSSTTTLSPFHQLLLHSWLPASRHEPKSDRHRLGRHFRL